MVIKISTQMELKNIPKIAPNSVIVMVCLQLFLVFPEQKQRFRISCCSKVNFLDEHIIKTFELPEVSYL